LAEKKPEEETYSLIYTSLKHPVRRKILRMIAQKPLSYSEILETLTVDSGHLSYHLERLGELIVHTKDGKYMPSTFGVAALRLMNGVEELPPQTPNKKHKISEYIPQVFSLLLAISLVVASVHFVTCTVPTTISLNQHDTSPTAFNINASQPYEFDITFHVIAYSDPTRSQVGLFGTYGSDAKRFSVTSIIDKPNAQSKVVMWLDFTIQNWTRSGTLEDVIRTDTWVPVLSPVDMVVDAYTPTENKSLGIIKRTDYSRYLASQVVEVNQEGTYRFVMRTNSSGEWTYYSASVTPNLQWQITEKPYVNYGILGFVISAGYIALVAYNALKSKNKNHLG